MKKFLLVLIVLTLSISPVYAGSLLYDYGRNDKDDGYIIKPYRSYNDRDQEYEERLRRLENRQRELEEKYERDRYRPKSLLGPGSKPGDSLLKGLGE